jgi:DNA invertase Pin-like site-specific DNA recombinase
MSTAKQDLSLDGQRKVILDWATSAGVAIVAWFDDPARSGATHPKRRQGLLDALRALETRRAGVLVVAADDRLSRDTNHAGWIATEVADLGAIVVDASKPEAEWITMMFGRIQAQSYLESLRKNTVRAMAVKKARGELVGSVPFGFSLAADGIHLEPHPVEHSVLVRILTLRQAGLGGRRIAAILTAEGHQPRGAAWNPGNLQVVADRWIANDLNLDPASTFRVNLSSPRERSA